MGRPLPGHRGRDRAPRRRRRAVVRRRSVEPGRARASSRCGPAGRRCSAATSTTTERYRKCFAGGWYLTGDLARRDADGYFWFVGRADDVIKSAGHLIGPFEVESALMEHPAVAEAGVIGKPDPVAGEIVKAFVVAASRASSRATSCGASCSASRRKRLGAAVAPKEIDVRRRACRRRAAARSCAACSRRASSACPKATLSTLEAERMSTTVDRASSTASTRSSCCAQMLRIRRFEEKCAELYSAGKIRGFLHLYIGEEAVAVGRDAGARRRTTPSSRPTASTATRSRAASRPSAIMAEMFGKAKGCSRGRGGSMHLFDARAPLLRRQRDRRRRPAARGRPRARRQAAAARQRVTACFFGEGAVAEGEFHESLNLAALWQLPVLFSARTTSTRWAPRSSARSPRPTSRCKARELRHARRGRSTAWTCSPSRRRRGARPTRSAAGGGPALPRAAHLPLPRPLDVRPRALPRQGRGRAVEAARPDRAFAARAATDRPARRRRPSPRSRREVAAEIDAAVALRRGRDAGSRSRT